MSATTSNTTRPKAPKAHWRQVQKRLEAAQEELRLALGSGVEPASVPEWPPPPGEYAADSAARDVEFVRRQGIIARLARIEAALERMRVGRYGRCDECDGEVEARRLEFDPAQRRCRACQEAVEGGLRTSTL